MMNKKEALIVIDVQNEYFTGKMPVTYPENSFDNIKKVILAAKAKKIPVVYIYHTVDAPDAPTFRKGSFEHQIHSDLLEIGADAMIEKKFVSSLYQTDLKAFLDKHEINAVTIAGYMTQMCCDTTARHAAHIGYQVNFLSDATGTLAFTNEQGTISAKQLHEATLITQAFAFSKVMSAEQWIKKIEE